MVRAFLKAEAVAQAPDAAGLERAISDLLGNDARRADLGVRARAVVEENLGATARTVALIKEGLTLYQPPPSAL